MQRQWFTFQRALSEGFLSRHHLQHLLFLLFLITPTLTGVEGEHQGTVGLAWPGIPHMELVLCAQQAQGMVD